MKWWYYEKESQRNFTSIFIVFVILVIIAGSGYFGIKYYKYIQTFEYKLKEIGYSKEEITTITNKLKDKEIKPILEKEYYPNLIKFINQKYFIYSNLDRYQNYYIKIRKILKILSVLLMLKLIMNFILMLKKLICLKVI